MTEIIYPFPIREPTREMIDLVALMEEARTCIARNVGIAAIDVCIDHVVIELEPGDVAEIRTVP